MTPENLASDLRNALDGEVRFDDSSRALYAVDASNFRQVPIGVVIPRSVQDVIATVELCRKYDAPVLARGGGTSLAGQCCNVAVVIDFTRHLDRILEINAEEGWARVQPGVILDDLRSAAEEHDLTFGPDPATHDHCTLGGMIGNNSCGVRSVMAGTTADNVIELDILTWDGARMTVGKTSEDELERIIEGGGRKGEIYGALKSLRDRYADQIRERFPDIPRRVSGYNLPDLLPENDFNIARALVGTECTCALVLEAKVRLVPARKERTLVVLGYPDIYEAADHVPDVLEFGPIGCEGLDEELTTDMQNKGLHVESLQLLPNGGGWLLVEFGADTIEDSKRQAEEMMEALRRRPDPPDMKLYTDPVEAQHVWEVRESGLGATAFVPAQHDTWPGWEDSSVPPEKLGDYIRKLQELYDEYGYDGDLYGHFGQGCVHTRIDFDLESAPGIRDYRDFLSDAAELVVSMGGSLSGEHGDGQQRAELLPIMYGDELVEAFREFKSTWDPKWKMNPGKIVSPYRVDENLRLGADYQQWEPETYFQFPEDDYRFSRATLRCVGVGKCRRSGGGVMCPSYMVTREEKHATRGRAHLLWEMLNGEVIDGGWKDESVKEALDLCLACKGCKKDCPVDVDMATYKAEFLAHYYEGRLRPMAAYSMGLIYWWSRIASKMPDLANTVLAAPLLSDVMKKLGGISTRAKTPLYAKQTFRQRFARRNAGVSPPAITGGVRVSKPSPPESQTERAHTRAEDPGTGRGEFRSGEAEEIILWPDTFNNHFHPETAEAAVDVLENLGFHVTIPNRILCCGRPLYDYGFLGIAKKMLLKIVDELRPQIRAGVPVVGLEPSCVSVFRDEMPNLLPHDLDAKRLSEQTYTLAEFLEEREVELPTLELEALVQGHCHDKSVLDFGQEQALFERIGLDTNIPDSGCCGMAGSFGFENEKYDVSVACGERVILPEVRAASKETLIIADGFSCREQIRQHTDRMPLHTAQVLRMAMSNGHSPVEYPERRYVEERTTPPIEKYAPIAIAGAVVAGVLAGVTLKRFLR